MAKKKRKLSKEEIAKLKNIIKKYPTISLKRLAKHFGVNKPSIRKTLEAMKKEMGKGSFPPIIDGGQGQPVGIKPYTYDHERGGIAEKG